MPEQRTSKDRKQHLYLVLDDWHSGYSIRKVSLSRRSGKRAVQPSSSDSGEDSEQPSSSGSGGNGAAKPLPLPVLMRVSAQRGFPEFSTSAFGTKIILMLPGAPGDDIFAVPTIDVHDRAISFESQLNCPVFPVYFPVSDDRLFALDMGKFEIIRRPEGSEPWVWQRLAFPPVLTLVPSSYGVQPDGCILVSTESEHVTYIFDAKEYVWKLYSNWVFPFTGHGYYDHSLSLGGLVGLSKHPETLGKLFCCIVTGDTGRGGLHPSPDFKCTKETVYSKDPAEKHVSATPVHMRQGRFCLVECVSIDNGLMTDQEEFMVPQGADTWDYVGVGPQCGRYMYRVKTFSLGYDTKGDLKLKNCKARCCSVPHEARIGSICQDPVAFWL